MSLRGYNENNPHTPVMLQEVLAHLSPHTDAHYIDATFGAGGYSRAILAAADCKVLAIDRDPDAIERAQGLQKEAAGHFQIHQGCFGEIDKIVVAQGLKKVDGIVFDIGVSSPQFDLAERGFSFQQEGPLDMRMSQKGLSAADILNTKDEEELADILWRYGEEKRSRAIAKAIVRQRAIKLFETTTELAALITKVYPKGYYKTHPATKTFQALRLYVNDELGELERGLAASEKILNEGGRLVVVTFHSLEDRIVKHFLQARVASKKKPSRLLPGEKSPEIKNITFALINRKPVIPTSIEIKKNPRARSAKLRAAMKLGDQNQMRGKQYGEATSP